MASIVFSVALLACYASAQLLSSMPAEVGASLKQDLLSIVQQGYKNLKYGETSNLRGTAEATGKYSSSGFVYQALHVGSVAADTTCSEPSSMYGEAVNRCFSNGLSFGYKFQLAEDSCKGTVIQFFTDATCRDYLGSTSLDVQERSCKESAHHYAFAEALGFPASQSLQCTTSGSTPLPIQTFQEPSCGGLDTVLAGRAGDTCTFTASIGYYTAHNCSTSSSFVFDYASTSCSGAGEEITAICYLDDTQDVLEDWDDDLYLPPGVFTDVDDGFQEYLDGVPRDSSAELELVMQQAEDRKAVGESVLRDLMDDDSVLAAASIAETLYSAVKDTDAEGEAESAVEDDEIDQWLYEEEEHAPLWPEDASLQEVEGFVDLDDDLTRAQDASAQRTYFLGMCAVSKPVSLDASGAVAARRLVGSRQWVVTSHTAAGTVGSSFLASASVENLLLLVVAAVALLSYTAVSALVRFDSGKQ